MAAVGYLIAVLIVAATCWAAIEPYRRRRYPRSSQRPPDRQDG